MLGISHWELLIVLGIVMLLFGGARIPGIARSMGKSITEFKKGVKGIEDDVDDDSKKAEDKPA